MSRSRSHDESEGEHQSLERRTARGRKSDRGDVAEGEQHTERSRENLRTTPASIPSPFGSPLARLAHFCASASGTTVLSERPRSSSAPGIPPRRPRMLPARSKPMYRVAWLAGSQLGEKPSSRAIASICLNSLWVKKIRKTPRSNGIASSPYRLLSSAQCL